jgi:large subunit ribosomal protein L10
MPNAKNKEVLTLLKDKVKKAKSIILADYIGIKAVDANSLRSKVKETGAEVTVAKNTLLKIALKESKIQSKEIDSDLNGSTLAVFSYADPIAPIKALLDFARGLELPKVKSAIIEGLYKNASEVEEISKIPSKEILLGKVLGGLSSPLKGFASSLNGVTRKFVYALSAIAEKK